MGTERSDVTLGSPLSSALIIGLTRAESVAWRLADLARANPAVTPSDIYDDALCVQRQLHAGFIRTAKSLHATAVKLVDGRRTVATFSVEY